MKFLLGELLSATGPLHTESNLGDIGLTDVGNTKTPVIVEVSVKDRRSSGFRVEGTVKTEFTLPCDRCLRDTLLPASGVIDVWVVLEDQPEYDDDAIRLAPGANEITLDGPVGEAILLAAPSKIVCRENCAGLCPQCGQDLNIERCDCRIDKLDDRWAALLKIKDKFKE